MFRKTFTLITLHKQFNNLSRKSTTNNSNTSLSRNISTTIAKCGIMEFFDDKKNWGASEVKSGRSWKTEELRLKSNTDLHKLWYVLLKERNMLLTMEEEAKNQCQLFPSPERLDKVQDSMDNLETVVRERNVAYHQLETGETGERPKKVMTSALGLKFCYKMTEHTIPEFMNKKHKETHHKYYPNRDTDAFLSKYREKLHLQKRKQRNRDFNHVIGLLNRFPDMDMEALKEQYPDVDIEKAKRSRRYGGHFVPK